MHAMDALNITRGFMRQEINKQGLVTKTEWIDLLRNINHIDYKSVDPEKYTLYGLIEEYLELTGWDDTFG
jgi:abortive infection bacteriophage resistance protein